MNEDIKLSDLKFTQDGSRYWAWHGDKRIAMLSVRYKTIDLHNEYVHLSEHLKLAFSKCHNAIPTLQIVGGYFLKKMAKK